MNSPSPSLNCLPTVAPLSLFCSFPQSVTHTHTHTHIYTCCSVCIRLFIYVYVCVCVSGGGLFNALQVGSCSRSGQIRAAHSFLLGGRESKRERERERGTLPLHSHKPLNCNNGATSTQTWIHSAPCGRSAEWQPTWRGSLLLVLLCLCTPLLSEAIILGVN